MPELPEVETVKAGLAPVMDGQTMTRVQVNRPDLRWPFPPNMAERLTGRQVIRLRRRSKYILVDLDGGDTVLIHLGMSGRILISGAPIGIFVHDHPAPEKHDHVVFDLSNGARITFNDPRRFGAMDLFPTLDEPLQPLLAKLGPEPLGNQFDGPYLAQAFKGRKSPVKTALLDQRIIAGLGNIYVCESLFRAKIHPARPAGKIAAARIETLVPIIRDVISEAITAGGSSLQDFRQTNGDLGYFQHSFRVYGREDAPCVTPDCPSRIRRIVHGGRSTFYCPTCQR